MKLYKELSKIYDLLYSYKDYDLETEFLMANLPATTEPRLLDVACGTGMHLKALRQKLPFAILAGIDINREMLNVALSKNLNARLVQGDMREFNLGQNFDIVYCLSSSIQYNTSREDLRRAISSMRRHTVNGKVIFDLSYCAERWREGYTNITANSDGRLDVAELYTSNSSGGLSYWNPLYLVKDRTTGEIDMHVDKHTIKLWSMTEVKDVLDSDNIPYIVRYDFKQRKKSLKVPIFILEGIKN